MSNKADKIIDSLKLIAHPEGGYYSETYRSPIAVADGNRVLSTAIYFLLKSGEVSHFHRIKSDEIWFYHDGSPLTVHMLTENGHEEIIVGPDIENGQKPQFLVPANTIFGSSVRDSNSFSLVSCVVSPGFDFEDFELFTSNELLNDYPNYIDIIRKLTVV